MPKDKKLPIMEIVKEVFENGFIDERNNQEEVVEYLGILTSPWKDKIYVVPLYKRCNLYYLFYNKDDGRVHLSQSGCGDKFDISEYDEDYQKAVDGYNSEHNYLSYLKNFSSFESLMLIKKADWKIQLEKKRSDIEAEN